ncbi:MAG: hypothetical protein L0206_25585, partial [Actinobacteria bacterium]|nr:hypothetical protein [Actinomycetota bacterium]
MSGVAERAREAAAPGIEDVKARTDETTQKARRRLRAPERLLVTVRMKNDPPALQVGCMLDRIRM